ncbi:MAG TPA: cytochrome c3 family protein [Methylomirabilota bacterium]|nr:cytochrome c3 family protein [Methylomirabilota bacterium]
MDRSRYFLIGLAVLLMAALVAVVGQSLTAGREPARVMPVVAAPTPTLPTEAGMYARVSRAAEYASMPTEPNRRRTLAVYYARRAYPGAPPAIPHPVDEREAFGKACLSCHGSGGWAPRFEAYAPVTPHPEMMSCRQCHVPLTPGGEGRARGPEAVRGSVSDWQTFAPPRLHGSAMPGSPPPIPHALQMRENCRACHAGPGAVSGLRTTHPERVTCRQCHALAAPPAEAFARAPERASR